MNLAFTKMHGIGNDYVYVNCLENPLESPEVIARIVSDRRFGIGSDGLVLILPSSKADFKMRMFNADGSEGKMCGNAIRCVGKYVYDNGLTTNTELTIGTKSGNKYLKLFVDQMNKVKLVEVSMGEAETTASSIPVKTEYDEFISQPMLIGGEVFLVTCVSMGNPHAVIFCEDVDSIPLDRIGPKFENNELFPEQINTEFVEIIDHQTLKMRVWERGSGETFACGTGACASVVAAVLNDHCEYDEKVTVRLRGGDLEVTYRSDKTVLMKGTATHVFEGIMEIDL